MPAATAAIVPTPGVVKASRPGQVGAIPVRDYPVVNATKHISGIVYNASSVAVVGATVLLFRQSDNFYCQQTTSDALGAYSFDRDTSDPYTYYVIAYSVTGGSTQIHGTSERNLVPA